jgi:hypothetical protein
MNTHVCVGIDVSQSQLDVAVRPGTGFSVPNDEPGWATVAVQMRHLAPVRIVLEATGGLEVPSRGHSPLLPFWPIGVSQGRKEVISSEAMTWRQQLTVKD